MSKRLLEYISIFGILLCVGLFLYSITELKKLSMQYEQLQKNVQQMMADKETNKQTSGSNEPETTETGFFGGSYLEKGSDSFLEWATETPVQGSEQSAESIESSYSLEKYEYLHSDSN